MQTNYSDVTWCSWIFEKKIYIFITKTIEIVAVNHKNVFIHFRTQFEDSFVLLHGIKIENTNKH